MGEGGAPWSEAVARDVPWVKGADKRICILVLGMHRSGTSALTRVLSLMGAALPKHIMGVGEGNETGHWEPVRLVEYHDKLLAELGSAWDDWRALDLSRLTVRRRDDIKAEIAAIIEADYADAPLFVVKDPRICRFAPLFMSALAEHGIETRALIACRNPLEVIGSLAARTGLWSADRSPAYGGLLWLRYALDAEAATRDMARAVVMYDGLLADWRTAVERVEVRLGVDWPYTSDDIADAIGRYLAPAQRHHTHTTEELMLDPTLRNWAGEAYQALDILQSNPASSAAAVTLDRIRREFDQAAPVLGRLLRDGGVAVSAAQARLRNGEAAWNTARAEAEAREAALRVEINVAQIQLREVEATWKTARAEAEAREAALRVEIDAAQKQLREAEAAGYTARAEGEAREATLRAKLEAAQAQLREGEETGHVARAEAEAREATLRAELEKRANLLDHCRAAYENSTSWRLSAPLRHAKLAILRAGQVGQNINRLIAQVGGVHKAIALTSKKLATRSPLHNFQRMKEHLCNPRRDLTFTHKLSADNPIVLRYDRLRDDCARRLRSDRGAVGTVRGDIRFSILVPVYKIQLRYLEAAIESVLNQTYSNWELCIVDDASECAATKDYLASKVNENPEQIKLVMRRTNGGISRATNEALQMATGDYICLFDHDDMLTQDALESIYEAVKGKSYHLVYSDECKIDPDGAPSDLFFKPDWDPYLLHNMMYVGHFSAYRADVIRALGGFRPEFDLSQDYDLALRLMDMRPDVWHVSKILYGWRSIPASAASGGKPQARQSNVAALQNAIERWGYQGKAVALPTANRVLHDRSAFNDKVAIIIPSDSRRNIRTAVQSIISNTNYLHYNIFVVTNSNDAKRLMLEPLFQDVRFVNYDNSFNFSDKCNVGASAADSCDHLVFFNDDVAVKSRDWIEALLDYLSIDGVGAVGPKLIYENGTLQHAGMVTGVRGLFGTAFHGLEAGTTAYFNLAQSVRQVSVICGACIAIKRLLFEEIGGFDAKQFPIAHSDVDLCFKIRIAGYACIYTPHAELYHIGHVAIGETERKRPALQRKDKADILSLKKWPEYSCRDPYFPPTMVSILYHDSPETFSISASIRGAARSGKDYLLAFHDLTNSGAPRALFEIARHLLSADHFVVAISPTAGPYAVKLREIGAVVVVDELLFRKHDTVAGFARNFDAVIVNTVVGWPLVNQMSGAVPCYWYIHETGLVDEYVQRDPEIIEAFRSAEQVWVAGQRGQSLVSPLRSDLRVIEYGFDLPYVDELTFERPDEGSDGIKILVVGSIEPRKGQDLAIAAVRELRNKSEIPIALHCLGRTLDQHFDTELRRMVRNVQDVQFHGEVSPTMASEEIGKTDILLIPSRDEPFSIVGIDALARGRIVVCGPAVGLFDYLVDGETGYLAKSSAPEDLAEAIARAIAARSDWWRVGRAARAVCASRFSSEAFKRRVLDNLGSQEQVSDPARP